MGHTDSELLLAARQQHLCLRATGEAMDQQLVGHGSDIQAWVSIVMGRTVGKAAATLSASVTNTVGVGTFEPD